jgi:hypothetical protein
VSHSRRVGKSPASSTIRHHFVAIVLAGLGLAGLERLPCLIGGLPGAITHSAKAASPEKRAAAPCHTTRMPSTEPGSKKACSHCSLGHEGIVSLSLATWEGRQSTDFVASTLPDVTRGAQRLSSPSSLRARAREPDALTRTAVRLL